MNKTSGIWTRLAAATGMYRLMIADPVTPDSHRLDRFEPNRPSISVPIVQLVQEMARPPQFHDGGMATRFWAAEAAHRSNNLAQLVEAVRRAFAKRGCATPQAELDAAADRLRELYTGFRGAAEGDDLRRCDDDLENLAVDLTTLLGATVGTVDLSVDVAPVTLSEPRRRALLLIASELIINALRHAFPARSGGRIAVVLAVDDDLMRLEVADDGVGTPAKPGGTGAALTDAMARMLDGRLTLVSQDRRGTRVTLGAPHAGRSAFRRMKAQMTKTIGVALALLVSVATQALGAPAPSTPGAFAGYRIDHHALGVQDFDAIAHWYVEKLGFHVEKTWTVDALPGARLGYLIGPGGYRIELVSGGKGPRTPSGATFKKHFDVKGYNHICFWVDDVDATADELKNRHVALFFPPTDFPVGAEQRVFFLKDPEDNVIEFAGPLLK